MIDTLLVRRICADVIELTRDAEHGDFAGNLAQARAAIPYDELTACLMRHEAFRSGPDIVLWGLPRTGTSWFFWHCFRLANTVKCAFKEINFLSTQHLENGYFSKGPLSEDWRMARRRIVNQAQGWLDNGFLELTVREIVFLVGPRDWDWYQLLVGGYGVTKGLDLTPANFAATPATLRELVRRGADPETFAFLRNPLAQVISYWRHEMHKHHGRGDDSEIVIEASHLAPWLWGDRCARAVQILPRMRFFYYDELSADPAAFYERVTRELGIGRHVSISGVGAIENKAHRTMPIRLTRAAFDMLREDTERLVGIVDGNRLDQWRRSFDRNATLVC